MTIPTVLFCPYCQKPQQQPPPQDAGKTFRCPHCQQEYRFTGVTAIPMPTTPTKPPKGAYAELQATEQMVLAGMTPQQQTLYFAEMRRSHKQTEAAFILCLLLGGIGAHRFYLGQWALGLVYVALCWTFLPLLSSLIELFVISGEVDRVNAQMVLTVAQRVRMAVPA